MVRRPVSTASLHASPTLCLLGSRLGSSLSMTGPDTSTTTQHTGYRAASSPHAAMNISLASRSTSLNSTGLLLTKTQVRSRLQRPSWLSTPGWRAGSSPDTSSPVSEATRSPVAGSRKLRKLSKPLAWLLPMTRATVSSKVSPATLLHRFTLSWYKLNLTSWFTMAKACTILFTLSSSSRRLLWFL